MHSIHDYTVRFPLLTVICFEMKVNVVLKCCFKKRGTVQFQTQNKQTGLCVCVCV